MTLRTIIAGSRGLTDPGYVKAAVKASGFKVTLVLSGTARGVDRLGEAWANERGIPVELYPADWNAQGKAAGALRNRLMVSKADALVAVWNGSPGTADVIAQARRAGLKVYVYRISDAA